MADVEDQSGPFYQDLAQESLSALWLNMANLAPLQPPPVAVPKLWKADLLRDFAMRAGRLISAEKAERRVVVLENPAGAGRSAVTPSLYAGVQLILPGEVARSHRHVASALRMVLEGRGGFTAVEGERVTMHPGDFIVTPSWTFHDHGNEGDEPVTWLDGLDVHIVNLLGAPFGEPHPERRQTLLRPEGDALARFGAGIVPIGHVNDGHGSPLFHYPYDRVRAALDRMARIGPWDGAQGLKVAYADPTTGRSPLPTMSAFLQLLPKGFSGQSLRVTDGTVYCVLEGGGKVRLDGETWAIGRHDLFVLPSWTWHAFEASEELVLFSFSDRVLQQHLGFWREERRPLS